MSTRRGYCPAVGEPVEDYLRLGEYRAVCALHAIGREVIVLRDGTWATHPPSRPFPVVASCLRCGERGVMLNWQTRTTQCISCKEEPVLAEAAEEWEAWIE